MFGDLCSHGRDGEDCDRPAYARGLCSAHYMRWYRYRDCGSAKIMVHGKYKLSHAKAIVIQRRIADGRWTRKQAAEHYGVTVTSIRNILEGKTWRAVHQGDTTDS